MLDRESTFANEDIVNLLKTRFVTVAIDQAYQRRQQDTEGEFYRRIVQQSPRRDFGNQTTQGLYAVAANGDFLGYTNNRTSDRVMQMLEKSLASFKPATAKRIAKETIDEQYSPQLPEDGLIVRVRAKVLGGYEPTEDHWQKIFQSAVSRDNLWITGDEHQALVRGEVPTALAQRITRYHLVDNTRGEPPMWEANEVKSVAMKIDDGTITGSVSLKTDSNSRGYDATIYGKIETANDKVTRLDIVVKGDFHGEDQYTKNAPKGNFPLAVTFELADGTDTADGIPPQASRGWLRGYFELEY